MIYMLKSVDVNVTKLMFSAAFKHPQIQMIPGCTRPSLGNVISMSQFDTWASSQSL